eukprot:7133895-Pyramimonas_sp.AAC.2
MAAGAKARAASYELGWERLTTHLPRGLVLNACSIDCAAPHHTQVLAHPHSHKSGSADWKLDSRKQLLKSKCLPVLGFSPAHARLCAPFWKRRRGKNVVKNQSTRFRVRIVFEGVFRFGDATEATPPETVTRANIIQVAPPYIHPALP